MDSIAGRVGFAVASLVLAIAALALVRHGEVGRQSFKAFYCAGAAVKEHRDPYLVEPMRSCERQIAPSTEPDGYVEPAPLPGYALVPFALLAMLPAKAAAWVFAIFLVLAAILSACFLAPLLPAPRAAVLLALAPLDAFERCLRRDPAVRALGDLRELPISFRRDAGQRRESPSPQR